MEGFNESIWYQLKLKGHSIKQLLEKRPFRWMNTVLSAGGSM